MLAPSKGSFSEEGERFGIKTNFVNIRSSLVTNRFILKRLIDFKAIVELRNFYRYQKFDVVVLNLLRAQVLGRLASIGLRTPKIVSVVHGPIMSNLGYAIMERLTSWIDTATVAISKDVKLYLETKGSIYRNVKVIHNGIDLKPWDKVPKVPYYLHKELGLQSNCKLIGLVAYMMPGVKGHECFIEAASMVAKLHSNAHFVLVGSNRYGTGSNYVQSLMKLIRELGITKRIHMLGDRTDIANIMDSFCMLVLPSIVREGFGLVLIEAMARGIPTIGSKLGGIPEVIEDGQTGLLVRPRDPVNLADAMSYLLANKQRAISMGKCGRNRVEKKFSCLKMVNGYEELLQTITNPKDN